MNCPRCGGLMGAVDLYLDGSKCTSWSCYRCGEVLDEVILLNRAARASRLLVGDSTMGLVLPLPEGKTSILSQT